MRPHNKETTHSNDSSVQHYLNSVREVRSSDSFTSVASWLRRIKHRDAAKHATPLFSERSKERRLRWAALAFTTLMVAGFIPIQDLDVLGQLVYAELDGDIIQSQKHMESFDFPASQAIYVRPSASNTTQIVLMLYGSSQNEIAPLVADMEADHALKDIQVQEVAEEIQRSVYDAFFANMPASLKPFWSKESFDLIRFNRLNAPIISAWLDTEETAYRAQYSRTGDTLRFSVLATGGTPLPTDREALFMEYDAVDRAIGLLSSDQETVLQARGLLEAYRDTLDMRISGFRE